MSFLSNIIRIVVWIVAINSVISSHFRGAMVTWKAANDSTDKILVTYRISWRRSSGSHDQCNSAAVSNRKLLAGEGVLRSGVNGSSTETSIVNADYHCVDFSEKQDWMTGERKNYLVGNITSKNFYIGFTGCCWIKDVQKGGSGDWRVWTKVNLNRRPDTGRINSSPFSSVQPIINVKHGCVHSIRIPVSDPDNDVVKCRFAKGFDECGAICQDLQGATIDQDKCIITYNANLNSGLYAVALQIEDFASKQSNTSLSSVALQFIVNVFKSSGNCSSMPYFSLTAPKQGFCHNLKVNETYTKKIVATSGSVNDDIVEFTTSSPTGMVKSSISKFNGANIDAMNVTWFYIDIEWTPTSSQKGVNIFCFTAVAHSMRNSERRCITFHVGDTNPSVVSTVPVNNSIIPFQNNTFSMTFDQDVSKPTMEKFIYVRQENGPVIVNISTSIFQLQSKRRISFVIPRSKLQEGQAYLITADEGFVQGMHTCGLPAIPLKSNAWHFVASNNYPFVIRPVVKVQVKEGRMQYVCNIPNISSNELARYLVKWYSQDLEFPLAAEIVKNATLSYLRDGQNSPSCHGAEVFCTVQSWFSNSSNIKSKVFESKPFLAGIKSEFEEVHIYEGGNPVKLKLSSTIPIVCKNTSTACEIEIAIAQQNSEVMLSRCSVKFGPNHPTEQEILIYPKEDFVVDGRRTVLLRKLLHKADNVKNWMCYEDSKPTKVIVDDRPTLQCRSTGDPHIWTFDNAYFDLHYSGDFTLAESDINNFKVQVRTYQCNTRVGCNCAVAVQENEDIITIDQCQRRPPKFRFPSSKNLHQGTKLMKVNNNNFEIRFPSGALVKVQTHWPYMSVFVILPGKYYNVTRGLCGTPDGDKRNELTNKNGQIHSMKRYPDPSFLNSWRLSKDQSLFYKKSGRKSCRKPAESNAEPQYCTCNYAGHVEKCTREGYASRPAFNRPNTKTILSSAFAKCQQDTTDSSKNQQKNLVIPDVPDAAIYQYTTPVVQPNFVQPKWPTTSGITYPEALRKCNDVIIKSKSGKACTKVFGNDFDVNVFLNECVADIQLADSFSYIKSALNSMTASCEEKALQEIKFWTNATTNGTFGPPADIANSICPNDCSKHGVCGNSTCVCNQGYEAADCSIDSNTPPVLLHNLTLCNSHQQDCQLAEILGSGFTDSGNLTCRLVKLLISGRPPYRQTRDVYVTNGTSVSSNEIVCKLPSVPSFAHQQTSLDNAAVLGGYEVEVSNDGKRFSNGTTVYIFYDSKCMTCEDQNGKCEKKKDSCLINDRCFMPGESNPADHSTYCNHLKRSNVFVKKPEFECNLQSRYITGNASITTEITTPENLTDAYQTCIGFCVVQKIRNSDIKTVSVLVKDDVTICNCHKKVIISESNSTKWKSCSLIFPEKTWKQRLVCDKTKMTLYLNKETLPKYQKLQVTFENHVECKNTANQTHLIIETSHDKCGTRLKETARHIIYENTAVLAIGNDTTSGKGIITRKLKIKYELECKYERQLNVSSTGSFKPVNASITTTERGFGKMTIALTMMKSSSYKQAYLPDDYPVPAKLTDRLYMQLELEATHANLKLTLQRCYATRSSNRNDQLRYNIILDRCPKDRTFLMHSNETKRYQFSIIAFRFLKESQGIYIHCAAVVCKTSSTDGRCNFGCVKTRQRRNAIENDMSKFYTVSSGYVKINSDNASNESQGNNISFWKSSNVYMIIGGVAAALSLLAIVVYGVRRGSQNTKKLEEDTELKGISNPATVFNE